MQMNPPHLRQPEDGIRFLRLDLGSRERQRAQQDAKPTDFSAIQDFMGASLAGRAIDLPRTTTPTHYPIGGGVRTDTQRRCFYSLGGAREDSRPFVTYSSFASCRVTQHGVQGCVQLFIVACPCE